MPLYQKNPDVAGFAMRENAQGRVEVVWLDESGNGSPILQFDAAGSGYSLTRLLDPTGPINVTDRRITVAN